MEEDEVANGEGVDCEMMKMIHFTGWIFLMEKRKYLGEGERN